MARGADLSKPETRALSERLAQAARAGYIYPAALTKGCGPASRSSRGRSHLSDRMASTAEGCNARNPEAQLAISCSGRRIDRLSRRKLRLHHPHGLATSGIFLSGIEMTCPPTSLLSSSTIWRWASLKLFAGGPSHLDHKANPNLSRRSTLIRRLSSLSLLLERMDAAWPNVTPP